jgi:hypothetical protein
MSDAPILSRRRVLQLAAGAPMLPIASSLTGLVFTQEAAAHGHSWLTYSFGSMAAPNLANPAQMATTYVDSTVTIGLRNRAGWAFKLG